MIEKTIRHTMTRHGMLRRGDRVLVAASGGPDSTALLAILSLLAPRIGVQIHVAHLNHGWRGRASDADAEFVRRLALRLGAPVTVGVVDPGEWTRKVRRQSSLEARARVVRRRFLVETARDVGATRIALGHTRDDQAESFLLRLLRGSGTRGLAAIYPVVDDLFIRPLLDVRRREVIAYLKRRRLRYRVDATNRDPRFRRIRVRRSLIPRLERDFNPEAVEALAGAAALLRDEDALLSELAASAYSRLARPREDGVVLPAAGLLDLPPALSRRVVRLGCLAARGHLLGITLRHVEEILEVASRRQGGALDLPGRLRAVVRHGDLTLRSGARGSAPLDDPEIAPCQEALCPVPGAVALPGFGMRLVARLVDRAPGEGSAGGDEAKALGAGPGRACLDADRVAGPLLIRPRRPGDCFLPLGAPGTRRVKTFLIDRKVPVDDRGRIPLVLSGERIAWVVGHQIDERFKVTSRTRRILVLDKEPR
jgi:tRNA(Ile)-lysidine synthase